MCCRHTEHRILLIFFAGINVFATDVATRVTLRVHRIHSGRVFPVALVHSSLLILIITFYQGFSRAACQTTGQTPKVEWVYCVPFASDIQSCIENTVRTVRVQNTTHFIYKSFNLYLFLIIISILNIYLRKIFVYFFILQYAPVFRAEH